MRKITPFLWFNDNAEEAANYYVSIFKNSRILNIARYGKSGAAASGRPEGSVMTVSFELEGEEFVALNGGPVFSFTPAISLVVNCRDQAEIDTLWEKLTSGGQAVECGWLTDRYGISWQIVPADIGRMMSDPDPAKRERVTKALIRMKKLDIDALRDAYEGHPQDIRPVRKAG